METEASKKGARVCSIGASFSINNNKFLYVRFSFITLFYVMFHFIAYLELVDHRSNISLAGPNRKLGNAETARRTENTMITKQ
jgi:hypothetical protein